MFTVSQTPDNFDIDNICSLVVVLVWFRDNYLSETGITLLNYVTYSEHADFGIAKWLLVFV